MPTTYSNCGGWKWMTLYPKQLMKLLVAQDLALLLALVEGQVVCSTQGVHSWWCLATLLQSSLGDLQHE